jgi:hypothetical protein
VTVALLGVLASACGGGAPDPLAALGDRIPSSVGGWTASGEDRRFDGESIFSYLDGHAEVYLAYGMDGCLARRYRGPGGEPDLVLDVFWMPTAEDAFGVFSWDQDGEAVAVGQGGLLRPSWLSAWQGRCFLSVYAEGESPASAEAMAELAAAVAAAVGEDGSRPHLVDALPGMGLEPRSVRFVRSRQALAIQLGVAPAVAPPVEAERGVVLARYRRGEEAARVLLWAGGDPVEGERTEADLRSWLEGRGDGQTGAVRRRGALVVMVHGSASPDLAVRLALEAAAGGDDGTPE